MIRNGNTFFFFLGQKFINKDPSLNRSYFLVMICYSRLLENGKVLLTKFYKRKSTCFIQYWFFFFFWGVMPQAEIFSALLGICWLVHVWWPKILEHKPLNMYTMYSTCLWWSWPHHTTNFTFSNTLIKLLFLYPLLQFINQNMVPIIFFLPVNHSQWGKKRNQTYEKMIHTKKDLN